MHTQTEKPSPPIIRNCSITKQSYLNVSYLDIEVQNSSDENLSYRFSSTINEEVSKSLYQSETNVFALRIPGTLTGNVSANSVDMCNRVSDQSSTIKCTIYSYSSKDKSSVKVLFTLTITIMLINL